MEIVMKTGLKSTASIRSGAGKALADFAVDLRRLYGRRLEALYLYGSYAKGTWNAGSDLDLLVVLRGPVNAGREIHAMAETASRVSLKYNQLLSTMPVSSDRFRKASTPFLRNIRPDLVAL